LRPRSTRRVCEGPGHRAARKRRARARSIALREQLRPRGAADGVQGNDGKTGGDGMSKHDHVLTEHAPKPIGPYSQAIMTGHELNWSGQIPLDPQTGEMVTGDVSVQTERALENLGAVLCAAGYHFTDVVKTTMFLIDMNDFAAANAVYEKYFGA